MLMEFDPLNDSRPPKEKQDYRTAPLNPPAEASAEAVSSPLESSSAAQGGPRFSARRWLLIAVGLTLLGVIGAFASVVLRRTRVDQTTRFWGPQVVRALQSSDEFRLRVPPGGSLEWKTESTDGMVDLSDTPGIAHLRHALLDERHYRWETSREVSIETVITEIPEAEWVTIELRGSPAGAVSEPPIEPVALKLELSRGWVGVSDGGRSVQMTDRVRSAVRHNLLMFSNVRSKRADVE